MRPNPTLAAGLLALFFTCQASAQEDIAKILSDPAIDYSRPDERARAMRRIEVIENARLQNARAKAMTMGLPLRMEKPGGGVKELIDFEDDQPVYLETKNVNAAISTAANLIQTSPYMLDGTGLTVGVWDAAGGRPTHQEFATGSRLTNMNGTAMHYHSMHVAGTIAALGVDAPSRGMANAARINSYDWNSDISEMGTAGATAPGQAAPIVYLSNHSYGTANGWDANTWTGTGTDQNAYDISFGQYSSSASSMDSTAYNTPYFLSFWAAGNDRSDNPATGASVVIGGVTTTYNPAIHPLGDGKYRNGYETISYRSTAKNALTVGAVNDAVTSGVRDLTKATISTFSSTGPTDDGRIKPDLVANGVGLKSTDIDADNDYRSLNGTSMATPNACGSATLLVDQYNRLFGSAMRSSTFKALLIHTADDIGNPGPDYFFGWGLMDAKDAADLLIDHQANPTKKHLTEDQISTSITSRTYSFTWDGVSPIRATLCWTDPAGTSVSSHDSRTPTLKNNLNLKLVAPNGAEHFPFVMPFVGTWTVASMSQNATTGINNTDNVEQVLVNSPGQSGDWQAVVSYSGTLTNSLQNYGLVISGSANQNTPLAVTSITPASGLTGTTVTADITGTNLSANTAIRLRQPGRTDIIGTSVQMINTTTLRCQFNLTGAASGTWNLVATNPDTETFTLPDAFTISGSLATLWSENFDGTVTGWTSQTTTGSNSWTITTAQSQSPTKSYFAAGPASQTTTYLISPSISIPANPTNLQIEFWHYRALESGDGGRFSLSTDGGAWFDVTDANSGAAFTSNGYNATMASNGQTGDFAGLQAWSGNSGGFIRTTINLNDIPKFAGKNLRLRWGFATNPKTASTGWYVDSVALLSDSSVPNQPPAITVAASTDTSEFETVGPTTYHVLRGTGTNLSVTATDDAGEPYLTYTWQSAGPAPVSYSLNANNAAKSTTATFSAIGDYVLTVTALDTGGLSTASTVNVRVLETTDFVVAPDTSILSIGQNQQFIATLINQFGSLLSPQPSPITWSTTGGGTITSDGLFTATSVGGPYHITANAGAYTDTAEVTVNRTQAGIELQNLSRIHSGSQQVVTAVTSPAGLAYSVTYNGQSTAPTNGGSYDVVATITDPNYEGTTSGTLVIAYTVSYQGNGNTSGTAPADQTKFHDVNLTLATNSGNLNKTEYSFVGWNTEPEGGGTDYPAGATYSGNASLTLHAKWALGADGIWSQTPAGPFDWGTSGNWNGGTVASGADRTASFTPNITAAQVVNLEASRTIGNITFTDSTTSSNDLTISGANILNLVRTSGMPTVNVTQSGRTLTISSQIAGNNGLQKNGAGTLTISGPNTYTGGTTLSAGILATTADGNFGTGGGLTANGTATWNAGVGSIVTYNRSITVSAGTLSLASGNALKTITGVLSGSGAINNTSTTTFEFNNTGNTFTGTVNNGYEMRFNSLGDSTNPINLVGSNSLFTWQGGAKTFALRPLTLNATGTGNFNNNGSGAVTIQQNLAITGTAGARTLALGGANTGTNTGTNTFSGNIADGTGSVVSLTKNGSGTWALGGTNTYTGNTNLSAALGRLVFQGGQSLSPNTRLIFAQSSSNVSNVRFLDDGAAPGIINLNRPIDFGGSNTSQVLGIFVGNNNTANLGGSSGTSTGRTIQVGDITHTSTAADTSSWSINVTSPDGYRLQTGTLMLNNLVTRTANNTTTTILNPTTANMTVDAITMATGNTGIANDGIPVLRLDGTSSDNRVTGVISNATDYLSGQALGVQKQNTSTWILTGANTYSGATTISGGTLQLGDGSSGNDGTIGNTSGITNNATLVFNRFGDVSSSVAISGTGAVTKTGPGSQTLSATNSYTGATSVNTGKLFINDNQSSATGNVSVSANATLGGTGTIGGNTIIAANGRLEFNLSTNAASHDKLELATGKSLTFSGASALTITVSGGATSGSYTLLTAPGGIFGNTPAPPNLPDGWTGSVSKIGNDLVLNLTAPDTTPPTLVSITDDKSGGPVPVNTLVTYTVTFSEDMDAGFVEAAGFGSTGASTVTIGIVNETSPGVFTVEATPTTAGSMRLRINQDAVLKDLAGNNLDTTSAILDDISISVNAADPYSAWSGGAAFNADTNGDGVENGLAWLLGAADPNVSATDLLPVVTQNGGNLTLTFKCLNADSRGSASLNVLHGSNLAMSDPWTAVAVPDTTPGAPSSGVTFSVEAASPTLNHVTATISSGEAASGKLFARLNGVSAP